MEQPGRHRCPGHRDWANLELGIKGKLWNNRGGIDAQATETGPNLSWGCGKAMEQPGRQRGSGHKGYATLRLGMTESYGTTGAAEMPRPPRLGQT